MPFGHEQRDVYRAAIEYVGQAFRLGERLKGHRSAKQLPRASQSVPPNIAEGNGKSMEGERRRYFDIARGSALECAAVQDVLEVCRALSAAENADAKILLDRIVPMRTKLGQPGYVIREVRNGYDGGKTDCDSDSDPDSDHTAR
jgi:four helix bundle protein